jgi:hypothetical protein
LKGDGFARLESFGRSGRGVLADVAELFDVLDPGFEDDGIERGEHVGDVPRRDGDRVVVRRCCRLGLCRDLACDEPKCLTTHGSKRKKEERNSRPTPRSSAGNEIWKVLCRNALSIENVLFSGNPWYLGAFTPSLIKTIALTPSAVPVTRNVCDVDLAKFRTGGSNLRSIPWSLMENLASGSGMVMVIVSEGAR